jgi:hypothetical protein
MEGNDMPADTQARLYATIKATPELHKAYDNADKPTAYMLLTQYTRKLLQSHPYESFSTPTLVNGFSVVGAPSKDWQTSFVENDKQANSEKPAEAPDPDELVVVYDFASSGLLEQFMGVVHQGQTLQPTGSISATGSDLAVGRADHWSPGTNSLDSFSTLDHAMRTVAAGALTAFAPSLRGQKVNVVIIDQGLHAASIPASNWGGGLDWIPGPPSTPVLAGTASRTSHGMMMARTILALAPDAVLYDVPLIPEERIASVDAFFSGLSSAQAVYAKLDREIVKRRTDDPTNPQYRGPWIFVNAWAIFDRATETSLGDYTENKNTSAGGHPLIAVIKSLIGQRGFDVIFAAGNCGDFDASPRCGERDRGPGSSIWGANALSEVITAGAVSSAETWIGYSSQGPGPSAHLAARKPDLCAPSNFRDTRDAAALNSGTSTACAMTAGVVAALRSNPGWNQTLVLPAKMQAALISGARKTQSTGWNGRLGNGILDAAGAIGNLPP